MPKYGIHIAPPTPVPRMPLKAARAPPLAAFFLGRIFSHKRHDEHPTYCFAFGRAGGRMHGRRVVDTARPANLGRDVLANWRVTLRLPT